MRLSTADWVILAIYFVSTFLIAWRLRGRAQQSLADFFVSGRGVPWWIAGTSMVATTFSADTPLAVTGLTANFGIAGNWLWWALLLSGIKVLKEFEPCTTLFPAYHLPAEEARARDLYGAVLDTLGV